MNNMDNCGCGPGAGLSNQSDNLMGGGFSMSQSNNGMNTMNPVNPMNNNAPMNNASNNNTSVDLNALLNANNSAQNNNSLNKYQMPEMPGSMSSGEQTTNEILASIAKNNINQLNELNENAEKETQKVGQKVAETAKETIALSKRHIMLATVFTLALAWNDAIKYYIGRSIKLNKASPFYYLYYALIVTVLAVIVHHLLM
jgi:hypothetical protein